MLLKYYLIVLSFILSSYVHNFFYKTQNIENVKQNSQSHFYIKAYTQTHTLNTSTNRYFDSIELNTIYIYKSNSFFIEHMLLGFEL